MAKQKLNQRGNATASVIDNTDRVLTNTPKESSLWAILVVLGITFLAFTSSLNNKFVNWDDDVNIVENENTAKLDGEHIKAIFTSDVIGNYNPLPILTLAIERHFVGLEGTWLYHWTNLALHLLCVFFVFKIGRKLNLSVTAAAICALLFGIHPMRVESVAWVTERKDVLFGAFYLAAFYYYIKYITTPEKKTKYYVIITVLFILSLLSKVQAVSLPLSMLALDYFLGRIQLNDIKGLFKSVVEKIPFFLLSLATGLINIYMLSQNSSISLKDDVTNFHFGHRLLIGAYSFVVYLIKLFIPYEMSPLYPYPSELDYPFYLAPLAVFAIFGAFFMLWKKDNRAVVFGFLFFFFNVVFMLQIVGAGQGFIADRFTYIPYLGCFFVIAYVWDTLKKNQSSSSTIFSAIIGIMLLVYGFMTFRQNKIWENGATLWTHVMKYYPESDMAHNNKARYQREVLRDFKSAIEGFSTAIKIKPKPETYNGRGKTYFDMGNGPEFTQKALADYDAALSMPEFELKKLKNDALAEIYANRGAAYGRLSDETKDKSYLQKALLDVTKSAEINPENDNAYLNGYLINSQLGNQKEAIRNIDEYSKLKPNEADMYYSRCIENRMLGDEQAAMQDINKALEYGPECIRKAKNTNERNEQTRYMAIYLLERAKINIKQNNLAAAKADLLGMRNYGGQVPAEYVQYTQ
jgi:protein O-mannosyl-transferase